jgi:hypothetical protein
LTRDIYIAGIFSSPAGRLAEESPNDLVRCSYLGALEDAHIDGSAIETIEADS